MRWSTKTHNKTKQKTRVPKKEATKMLLWEIFIIVMGYKSIVNLQVVGHVIINISHIELLLMSG
jgi:hypothetical protein